MGRRLANPVNHPLLLSDRSPRLAFCLFSVTHFSFWIDLCMYVTAPLQAASLSLWRLSCLLLLLCPSPRLPGAASPTPATPVVSLSRTTSRRGATHVSNMSTKRPGASHGARVRDGAEAGLQRWTVWSAVLSAALQGMRSGNVLRKPLGETLCCHERLGRSSTVKVC